MLMADLKWCLFAVLSLTPPSNKNKSKTKALGALKWSWANNKILIIKH